MSQQQKPASTLHRIIAPSLALVVCISLLGCMRLYFRHTGGYGPAVQHQQLFGAGAAAVVVVPEAGLRVLVPSSLSAAAVSAAVSAAAAASAAAAVPNTDYVSMTFSSNSSSNSNSSNSTQQQSEWDTHIIFDGNSKGRLDACLSRNNSSSSSSSDSSGWTDGTWLGAAPGGDAQQQQQGYMLPHSARVQQLIWQHQHPADCSKAKFLLYRNPRLGEGSHGVGSLLHLQTTMLLLALNSGRVLAEVPGTYLTDHPYCGNRTTVDTCYLRPLTHCQITPQQVASAYKLNGTAGSPDQALFTQANTTELDRLGRFLSASKLFPQKTQISQTVPKPFQALLADSGIPLKKQYYWWRAQGISYIVRPNEQALQELAVRKRDKLRGLPLAPGCVSLYIRHGDKHTEHQTYNDSEYESALEHLRQVDPSLTRQVFLSTEDPATVVYFTNATRNWSTTYVDMPRKPDRKKNNIVYMKEHGFAEEMLDGLLNLDLALTCDGFVSSINSNWARLIDELRSTVRCKARAKYMDVGRRSPKGLFFWY